MSFWKQKPWRLHTKLVGRDSVEPGFLSLRDQDSTESRPTVNGRIHASKRVKFRAASSIQAESGKA